MNALDYNDFTRKLFRLNFYEICIYAPELELRSNYANEHRKFKDNPSKYLLTLSDDVCSLIFKQHLL